ncbi:hypothetical protein EDD21DRAFT_381572 [Dissophora ornata]|nr:hypothetical protein BGZ58_009134 [Dissophora ornata]KAI8598769.1 hypothetical protein EDD21DRAFT_381572 [Dissophora ornata]
MTGSPKLCLAFALALSLVASASASLAEAAPAPAAAAPVAQGDVFDYSQYESPPIWQEYNRDEDLPINYRRGGARGGDIHGRRRRSTMERRIVAYSKNAHLSPNSEFGNLGLVNAQVETVIPASIAGLKRRSVKRDYDDEGDDESIVSIELQEEHDVEADNSFTFETMFEESEGADYNVDGEQEEEDEDEEGEEEEDEDEEEREEEEREEEEREEEEEEEDEEEEGEEDEYVENYDGVDENEELRLDNEAGLQDWIEEMKSEEYFDLAGHPDGKGLDDVQEEQQEQQFEEDLESDTPYDQDEPSPSEEEIFAASWHN